MQICRKAIVQETTQCSASIACAEDSSGRQTAQHYGALLCESGMCQPIPASAPHSLSYKIIAGPQEAGVSACRGSHPPAQAARRASHPFRRGMHHSAPPASGALDSFAPSLQGSAVQGRQLCFWPGSAQSRSFQVRTLSRTLQGLLSHLHLPSCGILLNSVCSCLLDLRQHLCQRQRLLCPLRAASLAAACCIYILTSRCAFPNSCASPAQQFDA